MKEVKVTRVFETSADILYAAWTEPDRMRRWLATEVESEARLGGTYRLVNREEDGTVNVHTGEYRILEPGRRIQQTFRHADSPQHPHAEETLEIRFLPLSPDRTEVTLIHTVAESAPSSEYPESLLAGWNAWLDLLEQHVEESRT